MSETDIPDLTLDVNGNRYKLNEEFLQAIQERAHREYEENHLFDCWWKIDADDPILVIETEGKVVPWDKLDELEVEMKDISDVQGDDWHEVDDTDDHVDGGGGMQSIKPDEAQPEDEQDSPEEEDMDRTHFGLTPRDFEEIPSPDSEDEEKVPPEPEEMDRGPALVWWVPRHPDIEERWDTGRAMVPVYSWVEWNVQNRVDEVRLSDDTEVEPDSHDHWESLLKAYDCEKVGEYTVSQSKPDDTEDESGQVERKGKDQYEDGKYGGDNWNV